MFLLLAVVFAGLDPARQQLADTFAEYGAAVQSGASGVQPDCRPRRVQATVSDDEYVGTAVLFHGFSACPQQWFAVAELLAAAGFDVLLPLNPGHGNSLDAPAEHGKCLTGCDGPLFKALDNNDGLPGSQEGYVTFVEQINTMARIAPGIKVVGGVSIGGALAAHAGMARDGDEPLYARQLIVNPIVQLTGKYDWILRTLNFLPWVRNQFMGWGDGCYEERQAGRAGFCTFRIKNSAATRQFGNSLLSSIKGTGGADVAVLYDKADPVTRNSAVRALADRYRIGSEDNADPQVCVFPFTMHSLLSTYDDINGDPKYWLAELACKVSSFLAAGTPFPKTDAQDQDEGGETLCALDCTATTCPYDHNDKKAPTCPTGDAPGNLAELASSQPAEDAVADVSVGRGPVARSVRRVALYDDRAKVTFD